MFGVRCKQGVISLCPLNYLQKYNAALRFHSHSPKLSISCGKKTGGRNVSVSLKNYASPRRYWVLRVYHRTAGCFQV